MGDSLLGLAALIAATLLLGSVIYVAVKAACISRICRMEPWAWRGLVVRLSGA